MPPCTTGPSRTQALDQTDTSSSRRYGHSSVVAKLLDEGAEDSEDSTGALAVTLAALSCRPRSLDVVTELLGMESSVFSLTRTPEGFGMDLDRRGVIVGYTGSARPAEVAHMPLGAVVTAVNGKEVSFSLPRLLLATALVAAIAVIPA